MIITEREREREAESQAEGEAGSMHREPECGIRSRVSRIAPWAKGRRSTAAPPRVPGGFFVAEYSRQGEQHVQKGGGPNGEDILTGKSKAWRKNVCRGSQNRKRASLLRTLNTRLRSLHFLNRQVLSQKLYFRNMDPVVCWVH